MNGSTLTVRGPSGTIEAEIRPGRGGEIAQIRFESESILAAWPEPGPRPDDTSFEDSQAAWLESYRGGWQELVPNAGAASCTDEVTHAFHGSASSEPWAVLEHGADGVVLEHVVERPPLSLRRNITVTDRGVSVTTVASNVGRSEATVAWGHHPAFQSPQGTAVLTGCGGPSRIDLDALAPSHFEVREAGSGVVVVRRPDGIRIELCWSPEDFPYMWIWTERYPTSWPFAGGDVTLVAIEPQIGSRPDGVGPARSRGETLRIAAGASVSRTVRMKFSRGPFLGRQP